MFCLAMRPVYARLALLLDPDGALYAYSNDAYLVSDPNNMSMALAAALSLHRKVALRIGGGGQAKRSSSNHLDANQQYFFCGSTPLKKVSRTSLQVSVLALVPLDILPTTLSSLLHP